MGDNPCFYYSTLFYIWVLEVVTTVATSPYLYFIALLCQVKSVIVKSILDLDYCAETDFLLSQIWAGFSVGNSEKSANLRAWSSDMYATFIQFEHFHLSKSGASINFVNTNCSVLTDSAFYFALPVLLCSMDILIPLTFISFVQCTEVLRMIMSPLNMYILIVH